MSRGPLHIHTNKRTINISQLSILWIRYQMSTLKNYIEKWDTSFICFTSNLNKSSLGSRRAIRGQNGKRHSLFIWIVFYTSKFYFSLYREYPRGWIFKPNDRCRRHQKGCSTMQNFLLEVNSNILQKGVWNSKDAIWRGTSTTIKPPLIKAYLYYYWFIHYNFASRKLFTLTWGNSPIWVTLHQGIWTLCPCKFLLLDMKSYTFMTKRFQSTFP